jgi:hypothetical protein
MLQSVPPNTQFLCGIASVAFIGDDQIERINWDVELVCVVLIISIIRLWEGCLGTEKVSRHPLNRRYVHKRMAGFRRGQILVWQNLWIKRGIISKVFPLETLTIDLVFLGELVPFWRIESIEFADCLGCEGLTINQKEDFSDQL